MTLLARILSHGFAIAIVILLAISLINRGELFPEYDLPDFLDIGKLADSRKQAPGGAPEGETSDTETAPVAEAEQAEQEPPAGEASRAQPPAAEPDQATEPATRQPVAGSEPEPAPAPQEAAVATGPEAAASRPPVAAPAAEETGPTPADALMQEEETRPGGTPEASAQPPAEAAADSAARTVTPQPQAPEPPSAARSAAAGNAAKVKPYQLLADAREAYWLRDYDTAESKYLELTRVEPDNPDGYGELGNMYFSQGNWEQAAAAYYEAGIRLVNQGLLTQAEEMLAVIRGLNGANAGDLAQRIEAARGNGE